MLKLFCITEANSVRYYVPVRDSFEWLSVAFHVTFSSTMSHDVRIVYLVTVSRTAFLLGAQHEKGCVEKNPPFSLVT